MTSWMFMSKNRVQDAKRIFEFNFESDCNQLFNIDASQASKETDPTSNID